MIPTTTLLRLTTTFYNFITFTMNANNIQRIIYDPSQIVELINNKNIGKIEK